MWSPVRHQMPTNSWKQLFQKKNFMFEKCTEPLVLSTNYIFLNFVCKLFMPNSWLSCPVFFQGCIHTKIDRWSCLDISKIQSSINKGWGRLYPEYSWSPNSTNLHLDFYLLTYKEKRHLLPRVLHHNTFRGFLFDQHQYCNTFSAGHHQYYNTFLLDATSKF